MAAGRIQLGGVVLVSQLDTAGLPLTGAEIDVSLEISSMVPVRSRAQVTRPATYGRPAAETRLGVEQPGTCTVGYEFDEDASGLFYSAALAAFNSSSGELFVRIRYKPGAASATNPEQRFYLSVAEFQIGQTVSEWKTTNRTFPARTFTVSTT